MQDIRFWSNHNVDPLLSHITSEWHQSKTSSLYVYISQWLTHVISITWVDLLSFARVGVLLLLLSFATWNFWIKFSIQNILGTFYIDKQMSKHLVRYKKILSPHQHVSTKLSLARMRFYFQYQSKEVVNSPSSNSSTSLELYWLPILML